MPVESDLVTYLDGLLSETGGTDLFEGQAPDPPDNLLAVVHYGGEDAEDRIMGPSLTGPGLEVAHVQLFARHTAKSTAQARAAAAHAVLDGYHGTISGRAYHIESMDSEPFGLGQDQSERWRYVCNYRVRKARG